jgi:hypothetical protein
MNGLMRILAQNSNGGGGAAMAVVLLIELALAIVVLAGMWKVFTKAGKPGWGVLIPIYNLYLLIKIAGKPGWWLILMFIPIVNVVIGIIVAVAIAKAFGKGVGFALGLIFLGFIFYPILGFGDAQYQGPGGVEQRGFTPIYSPPTQA